MTPRIRVLWIEDETQHEMQGFVGRLYTDLNFDVTIADDATKALRALRHDFDVIVVDIRIPPGEDPALQTFYNDNQGDPAAAKLGLVLLEFLLGSLSKSSTLGRALSEVLKHDGPLAVDPSRFGVFSVEADLVRQDLESLGIRHILPKRVGLPRAYLGHFVTKIAEGTERA